MAGAFSSAFSSAFDVGAGSPSTSVAVFAYYYREETTMYLRQSTASQEVLLGPFVDSTDGVTAETGLTIANTDIKLWKGGTTTEANKNSGGGTHIASGRYSAVLDATDTDTVGMLEVNIAVAGALPVRRQFYVLEEAVYDALFAGSSAGYQVPIWASAGSTVNLSGTTISTSQAVASVTNAVTVGTINANVITATSIANSAITNAKFAAGAIDAAAIATDAIGADEISAAAVTKIQTGLATPTNITGATGIVISGISLTAITTAVWGAATRRLTDGTNIVLAKGTGITGFNDPSAGDIADAVWDEPTLGHTTLGTYGLLLDDAQANIAEMLPLVQVVHDDWINGGRLDLLLDGVKLWTDRLGTAMEVDGAVYRFTVNALEQAPAGGGGGSTDWTADERTAIRSILGIPGSGTTPADPTTGILDTIRDRTLLLSTQTSVDGKPTLSQIEASTVLAKEATLNGMRGATFDTATDSLEAIRNRGDAAWVTGSGSGGGGSSVILGSANTITRNINEQIPIQFTWPSASATITATVELGTASAVSCQGAVSFVRTDTAGLHWYQLAYDADDRPTTSGLARYVFTDGSSEFTVPVQFTEVASGGGGGISLPFAGAVADRVEGTKLQAFFNENTPISIAVVDSSGNAVTVTGRTLRVSIEDKKGVDKLIIADGLITKSGSTVTFTVTTAVTSTPTSYYWSLRDITSGNVVILQGVLDVVYAAEADA